MITAKLCNSYETNSPRIILCNWWLLRQQTLQCWVTRNLRNSLENISWRILLRNWLRWIVAMAPKIIPPEFFCVSSFFFAGGGYVSRFGGFWQPPGNNCYPEVFWPKPLTKLLHACCLAKPYFYWIFRFRFISNRNWQNIQIRKMRFWTRWSQNSEFREIGREFRRHRKTSPISASGKEPWKR